jgi:arginyl-tRNA synthetase
MRDEIERQIAAVCQDLFDVQANAALTRPEEQFGDYDTNIALQLSKQVGKNPREIAEALAVKLRETLAGQVIDITIAGPGFINFKLSDDALLKAVKAQPTKVFADQEVLVEFGDPNPFKAMHIGHLYSYIVGDVISSLLEAAGAKVKRLSYHGDVGLHVAKAIWAMQQAGSVEGDIGLFYAKGAKAYDEDPQAHERIDIINAKIYAQDLSIKELYEEGKEQSFASFDETLNELHIKTDQRYLESQSADVGVTIVKQHIGKVFSESEGAIVYEGEKVGLHTRVFITGKGLPTYEAKDLGLTELKNKDYPNAARSIIITAHEQAEYFKVMLAALKEINADLADKTQHLSHGFVSLSSGKMSSRTGEVYNAVSLLADVEELAQKLYPNTSHDTQLGAIKYTFLKHRLGGDLIYDVEESVSLEGNSGPYLQYAHARACSILGKASGEGSTEISSGFESGERSLARKISEYPEVVDKAVAELAPHLICTYLYELAQVFNRFYEHNRVIGDERQVQRLALVRKYSNTLKTGLELLGIAAPEKM